jgi:hypothetical protein
MVKKPKLSLAASSPELREPANVPPRPLGKDGKALWRAVTLAYQIEDEGGREILAQACAALDRAEGLRVQIDADGPIIRQKGGLRDHPGLKHELANRAFVTRCVGRLGLDVEAVKPVGRPPQAY